MRTLPHVAPSHALLLSLSLDSSPSRLIPAIVPSPRYQVEREIRIHIDLEHENVIRLHAAFEDEKNVYMVQVGMVWRSRAMGISWA